MNLLGQVLQVVMDMQNMPAASAYRQFMREHTQIKDGEQVIVVDEEGLKKMQELAENVQQEQNDFWRAVDEKKERR